MLEPSSSEDENEDVALSKSDIMSAAGVSGREAAIHAAHQRQQQQQTHQQQQQQQHHPNQSPSSLPRSISPALTSSHSGTSSMRTGSVDRLSLTGSRLASFTNRSVSPSPSSISSDTAATSVSQGGVVASGSGSINGKELLSIGTGNKSLDETERAEKEEQERKMRLQLYVFVIRCISYPFNAKQPTDMTRRQLKVTKTQLEQMIARFKRFLDGELQLHCDDAFIQIVQCYFQRFLISDRCAIMVNSGACSLNDFCSIFRNSVEKRVKSLPEIDGISKEAVLNSWMSKFELLIRGDDDNNKKSSSSTPSRSQQSIQQGNLAAEMILTKEQLYDMFQHILTIKKFEHQLLFNALQVSSLRIYSYGLGILYYR